MRKPNSQPFKKMAKVTLLVGGKAGGRAEDFAGCDCKAHVLTHLKESGQVVAELS